MNNLKKFEEGCISLATAFMHHKDPELDGSYKLGDGVSEYFIGSENTDFGHFADGSEFYTWRLEEMYTILKNNIPYEVAVEHFDWMMELGDQKDTYGVNLEGYYKYKKENGGLAIAELQRKIKRDYHERQAIVLSEEHIKKEKEYMDSKFKEFQEVLRNCKL